jgi:hypothetical protein
MQERPGSVTAVAILSIIVGSLGLILYCICGFWVILLLNPTAIHLTDIRSIPGYVPVTTITFIANMVLSSLFLTCGIGMLLMGQWARVLGIICGFANLLVHFSTIIYNYAVVKPALARMPVNVIREIFFGNQDQIVIALGIGVMEILFSIAAIIVLLLPGVGAAFAMAGRYGGRGRPPYEDRDDYRRPPQDDRDDDYRRPPPRYRDDEDW